MNMRLKVLSNLVLLVFFLLIVPGVMAAEEYTSKGADSCLMCHRAEKWGVMPIFDSKHGSLTDPDAPFSNEQCESCHGPSNAHAKAKKKSEVKPARHFRRRRRRLRCTAERSLPGLSPGPHRDGLVR